MRNPLPESVKQGSALSGGRPGIIRFPMDTFKLFRAASTVAKQPKEAAV